MIKLYGMDLSSNVNKVRYVLNYLGLEFEHEPTNPMEGQNQTPEYKAIAPSGKIPGLEVDGFTLFESNAINKYLAQSNNSDIYPTDIKEQAVVDAWTDYAAIHIASAMGRITFNRVFAPMMGRDVDEASIAAGVEFLDRYLPVVDEQLGKGEYLTGSNITIADFNLLAVLDPSELSKVSLDAYPNLTKWRKKLIAQDFYQKCYADYTEYVQNFMSNV